MLAGLRMAGDIVPKETKPSVSRAARNTPSTLIVCDNGMGNAGGMHADAANTVGAATMAP